MFVLLLIPSSAAAVSNKDMLHALLINYALCYLATDQKVCLYCSSILRPNMVSSDAVAFNTFP